MGREDILIQKFNEDTSGKNYTQAQRVLRSDLVGSVNITNEDELICIDGNVISENLFSEYHTTIEIDTRKFNILSTFCSCTDYEKNEFNKKNYCCKHLVATFYKSLDDLSKHPALSRVQGKDKGIFKSDTGILAMILGDEGKGSEIKLEVVVNKHEWTDKLLVEFRIGLKNSSSSGLYVLKDVEQFLLAYHNNIPIKYSKNFTFSIKEQKLSTKDRKLIEFIEMLQEIDNRYKSFNRSVDRNIDGKHVRIPKYLTREFFQVVQKHRVYLDEGFFYRQVEADIVNGEPDIDFDLKLIKDEYVLKSINGMPVPLSSKNDVFIQGTTIFLPDYDFCYRIEPYLKVFNNSKVITIPDSQEEMVLKNLIPQLQLISTEVMLSKKIQDKVVIADVKFKFYFNKENSKVSLILKVNYGQYEFNIFEDIEEKIIYRDVKKEQQIIGLLRTLGFNEINNKFYLIMGDDYIFNFFKYEINKLHDSGEVFYSENFKGLKAIGSKGIKGNITPGKYNYFELDFKLGDIPPDETKHILRAFRDNLKYYKLKTGDYLDLEELELKKFLKLLDVVSSNDIEENNIEILKNKGLYFANYLEENNIKYLKGNTALKDLKTKFKKIDSTKTKLPDNINAALRDYQKVGFNWFKTLEYLEFGGILGDEMGLGKTLQTITFLLSNKGAKSLIIAPTSLIYNWVSEFEKFAPTMKVISNNGNKDERDEVIKNLDKYDVVITTYNLLKRDLDLYKAIEFDYCILDEAQNIKNPQSQNAVAVKEINSKCRFALTGTPIENSLMELWSIFDFVMPGYLYDEKRFSVRYHKRLKEDPVVIEELNKLIKPFILRRRKKDVIKELPDKIEKRLVVSMNDDQKKIYGTYAKHAMELIEKKIQDDEFNNSKIEILAYLTKLRQICLDPSVVVDDYNGGSGKIDALLEVLHQSVEEGHKILVFSQFTSVLKNIGKTLNNEGITFSYLDGSVPSEKRMTMVKDFNEGNNSVFLISLKAGGTGLNLTSADIVIHFDPWWNPAVEEQATDRAHRIGQKNVVEVIKMVAKGTIEEKVVALQDEKRELISKLMGNELSSGESIGSLSEEELISLFEVDYLG